MTFECTSTTVKTVTQILKLLFLGRISQRKQQVGLTWTSLQNITVNYRIMYGILYIKWKEFQISLYTDINEFSFFDVFRIHAKVQTGQCLLSCLWAQRWLPNNWLPHNLSVDEKKVFLWNR